jgi:phytoene dehydrogenase-like protein
MTPDFDTDLSFDAIVIGAGHNGLVCAAYLARARKKVLVIERQAQIGGAALTAEISPQFNGPVCAHLLYGFAPDIIKDLKLKERGLILSKQPTPLVALAEDQRHIVLGEDAARTKAMIAAHSQTDADAYEEFADTLRALAVALRPLVTAPPPPAGSGIDPKSPAHRALDEADRLIGRLEPEARRVLSELVTGSIADVLERSFETPLLQGAYALKACLGNAYGPRGAGSGLAFLIRLALERDGKTLLTTYPKGGLGGFVQALAASAQKAGAQIRTGSAVTGILMEGGRAAGVRLEDGTAIRAPTVISNADPKETFLKLVPQGLLGTGFRRAIGRLRSTAYTAKVNLALDGLPDVPGLDYDTLGGRLMIAPGLTAIEDALAEAHAGRYSTAPVMEVTLPTIHDPELAPVGQHVVSVIVQYAPYETEGGWPAMRDEFAACVLDTLARYMPDIRSRVLAGDVLSPQDLERNYGLPRGNWHHIEPAPDQLFWLRPAPGAEAYATPLAGLYLCGVGSHPAGDITGLAGRNAAQVILAAERKR